jgi:hypothetical protein
MQVHPPRIDISCEAFLEPFCVGIVFRAADVDEEPFQFYKYITVDRCTDDDIVPVVTFPRHSLCMRDSLYLWEYNDHCICLTPGIQHG